MIKIALTAFAFILLPLAGMLNAQTIVCDGCVCGGTGVVDCGGIRDYVYRVSTTTSGTNDSVVIGTYDPVMVNYTNKCMPSGWDMKILSQSCSDYNAPSRHGDISPASNGLCPYTILFYYASGSHHLSSTPTDFGFNHSGYPHNVNWRIATPTSTSANWTQAVGMGAGPVHGPGYDTNCVGGTIFPQQTCLAGKKDNFNTSDGDELSSPSAALLAYIKTVGGGADTLFDATVSDRCFGHTFQNCWNDTCEIIGGQLCMKITPISAGASNDAIYLHEEATNYFWGLYLRHLKAYLSGNPADTFLVVGDTLNACLDLAQMPVFNTGTGSFSYRNLLGMIQDGELDFIMQDDSKIDYLELKVRSCCDTNYFNGIQVIPSTGEGFIRPNTDIRFDVKLTNQTWHYIMGTTNGFRVYSPDGATWAPLTWDTAGGIGGYFNTAFSVQQFSNDGMGADTIGWGGFGMPSPPHGIPNGYNDVVLKIKTRVDANQAGDTICVDSSWWPPSGRWQWALSGGGNYYPDWGGPYCFLIVSPGDTCNATADINNDGIPLTISDLAYLSAFLNQCGPIPPNLFTADLNGDCVISSADSALFRAYFTSGLSVFNPYGGYPVPTCCNPTVSAPRDTITIFGLKHVANNFACLDTGGGVINIINRQPGGGCNVILNGGGDDSIFTNYLADFSTPEEDSIPMGSTIMITRYGKINGIPNQPVATSYKQRMDDSTYLFTSEFNNALVGSSLLCYKLYLKGDLVASTVRPLEPVTVYGGGKSYGDPMDGVDVVILKKPANSANLGPTSKQKLTGPSKVKLPGMSNAMSADLIEVNIQNPCMTISSDDPDFFLAYIAMDSTFRLSLPDEQAVPPKITPRFGLQNAAKGFAKLDTISGGGLLVSNIGSINEDGLLVNLCGTDGISWRWDSPTSCDDIEHTWATLWSGTENDADSLGIVSSRWTGDTGTISVDYSNIGITSYAIYTRTDSSGNPILRSSNHSGTVKYTRLAKGPGDPYGGLDVSIINKVSGGFGLKAQVKANETVNFDLGGGQIYAGKFMEFEAIDDTCWCPPLCNCPLSMADMRVTNRDTVRLRSERIIMNGISLGAGSNAKFAYHDSGLAIVNAGAPQPVEFNTTSEEAQAFYHIGIRSCCPYHLPDSLLPMNASLSITALGQVDGAPNHVISDNSVTKTGNSEWQVSSDFSAIGGTLQTVKIYNNGSPVATVTGHSGPAAIAEMIPYGYELVSSPLTRFKWDQPINLTIIDGKDEIKALGDELVIISENHNEVVKYLTSTDITFDKIDEVILTDITASYGSECVPGDANGNGIFNALDVTYLINYLYKHGPAPKPYPISSGDANCNCTINALDVTYLINYLYKHGHHPCDCGAWLGSCGPAK